MLRVELSTVVKAPHEVCAAFFREPLNFAKIDRKVRRMKILERGANHSLVLLYGVFGGLFPYWLTLRMETQPDGGFIAYRVKGPLKSFDAVFTLQPVLEGTRITHVEAYDFYGLIPGIADRLFYPMVKRIVEEELYRLRRYIEEGPDLDLPWD